MSRFDSTVVRLTLLVGALSLSACERQPPAKRGAERPQSGPSDPRIEASAPPIHPEVGDEIAPRPERNEPPNEGRHKAQELAPKVPKAELPPELPLAKPIEVSVPGDRSLRVTHAAPQQEHAIVYLHGMCGNSKGADPWVDLASTYGTVIVVRANVPCGDRPGFKWPKDVSAIQARIDRALRHVKDQREGLLSTEHPTIVGYSQGAHRAELLVAAYPGRYDRAILGGPPTAPTYEALSSLTAVAVLGGELEDHSHMLEGAQALVEEGSRARFFLLPRVHHGSYGPQGRRVLTDALRFVFEEPATNERVIDPRREID